MRILIFGATGLLGKDLMQAWHDDDVVTGLGSTDADIRDAGQVSAAVERAAPDWIVLSAAYTDVDGCETNRDLAFAVNRDGAINVAKAAKAHGARLLFVSTDYVFDGKGKAPYETAHPRAPLGVYGQSKAQAEEALLKVLPDVCIARTSWLFGIHGKCFPDTILKLAATRKEIDVVTDQRGYPTYSVDLAQALAALCHADAKGIVHVTNRGDCSWFEFAQEILKQAGSETVVRPTTSDKFVRPAPRPAYSVLSAKSLEGFGIAMPDWRDALGRYLSRKDKKA
jgi:dTDP-4-dehydrorhamnose reductase